GIATHDGFCPNGTPQGMHQPEGVSIWGSFCDKGGGNVGRIATHEFLAPAALNLYLAGNVGSPGLRLLLVNSRSEQTELKPSPQPAGQWQSRTLPVPPEWIGTWVQLVAEDHDIGSTAWLAFSLPILPASALSLSVDTSLPQSGFCPDGVYSTTKWPSGKSP